MFLGQAHLKTFLSHGGERKDLLLMNVLLLCEGNWFSWNENDEICLLMKVFLIMPINDCFEMENDEFQLWMNVIGHYDCIIQSMNDWLVMEHGNNENMIWFWFQILMFANRHFFNCSHWILLLFNSFKQIALMLKFSIIFVKLLFIERNLLWTIVVDYRELDLVLIVYDIHNRMFWTKRLSIWLVAL